MRIAFLNITLCEVCSSVVDKDWVESMDGFAGIQEHPKELLTCKAERLAVAGELCSWKCFHYIAAVTS